MSKKMILDLLWSVALICGIALCLWGINLPYVGIYNANNNYLALASKNFLRFGYTALHFLPTYYVGEVLPPVVPYYLHHPILFFLFASLPFALFGSADWVVHVATGLSVLAYLLALYALVREVSDREVARWTAVFALLIPLTSFFWKYAFFEQASVLITLVILYGAVRYWKTGQIGWLIAIGTGAAIGSASDWYGGYLVFGFLYLLFARTKQHVWPVFCSYLIGMVLGFGTYVLALRGTGNLSAVMDGFGGRGLTSELTSLSYWPIRLMGVTLLRILLYGSPLIIGAVWSLARQRKALVKFSLLKPLGYVFLIMGLVNVIVLPSATWGHSYFLYYLMPFIALVCGFWVASISKRSIMAVCLILLFQIIWSIGVDGFKRTQVTKQIWKYEFGRDISHIVPRYSRVGVVEYPGDVLQNYFFIDAIPLTREEVTLWGRNASYTDIRYVLVACKGDCTPQELAFVHRLGKSTGVQEYHYKEHTGWLFDTETPVQAGTTVSLPADALVPSFREPSVILRWYRLIRDSLGSTQI